MLSFADNDWVCASLATAGQDAAIDPAPAADWLFLYPREERERRRGGSVELRDKREDDMTSLLSSGLLLLTSLIFNPELSSQHPISIWFALVIKRRRCQRRTGELLSEPRWHQLASQLPPLTHMIISFGPRSPRRFEDFPGFSHYLNVQKHFHILTESR